MKPYILALGTSVPANALDQTETASFMIDALSLNKFDSLKIRKLYKNSAISTRYSILDDFKKPRKEWSFWNKNFPQEVPSTLVRNLLYKQHAPELALKAAQTALANWGQDHKLITHVVFVSCTGMMAPGIEFLLIDKLNLNRSCNRLAINFMGCFGAFKGLSVAKSFAKESPHHRVLVVCTELSSLHMQSDLDMDILVANSLFGDGAAAAIVGCEPTSTEKPLWEIVKNESYAFENSLDKMSWETCDTGYSMRLSAQVPELLRQHIASFATTLLGTEVPFSNCDWAIHPGGKAILQCIEKEVGLSKEQTLASWKTLENYGNMSSATFLFVLDELHKQKSAYKWSLGLGFGPGLSIEGILLSKPNE